MTATVNINNNRKPIIFRNIVRIYHIRLMIIISLIYVRNIAYKFNILRRILLCMFAFITAITKAPNHLYDFNNRFLVSPADYNNKCNSKKNRFHIDRGVK